MSLSLLLFSAGIKLGVSFRDLVQGNSEDLSDVLIQNALDLSRATSDTRLSDSTGLDVYLTRTCEFPAHPGHGLLLPGIVAISVSSEIDT